jgi:mono/diheme cytochrome c family protein
MSVRGGLKPVARRAGAGVALLLVVTAASGGPNVFNPAPVQAADGQQIYQHICQGCHMADGKGAVGAGRYPALAKDPALASSQYMAVTLLFGRRNMPAFGAGHAIGFVGPPPVLTPAQIAMVINYVRTHFGNHYSDEITAAEVGALDPGTP